MRKSLVLFAIILLACFSMGVSAQSRKFKTADYALETTMRDFGSETPRDWQNKEIARVLKLHPKTKRFYFNWNFHLGATSTDCVAYYNRSRRMLSFYAYGCASLEGPYIGSHYLFINVTDDLLLKIASLKKYSKTAVDPWISRKSYKRREAFDRSYQDDINYLPWFNELRTFGCRRIKLRFYPQQ